MHNKLHLHLFGTPQFTYQGKPITGFVSNKARALLIYLAVTGRAHSRATLAELLWADTPTTAKQNLKKALGNLRKLSGVSLIEGADRLIGLDQAQCWVDVVVLTEITKSADQEIDALQQVAQLYQADFLDAFNTSLSYEFEAWALGERQRLQSALTNLLQRLAAHLEHQGDLVAALAPLQRLLTIEPWREEVHRQVMTLLAGNGDRSGALMQFERCRDALAAELDVEPDTRTIALLEQIRRNELAPDGLPTPPLISPLGTAVSLLRKHNLPASTTPLIGRETAIAEVTRLLANSDRRLVTILGAGGMGKTRLALAVAGAQFAQFADVYWIPLAALTDPAHIVFAIGEALDFSFQGKRPPLQLLCDFLSDRQLLLVLDNMEQLLAGVSIISEILTNAPAVALLTTSRERLQLASETVFLLEGLAYPPTTADAPQRQDEPHAPSTYPALQLFLEQMQRVRPAYQPEPDDWPAITQVCQLVHGIPLGIQLAAAWGRLLSPAEIAAEISKDLDFLQTELQDIPDRQRSLRIVFAHTWQRLSEVERNAMMRLSVFRGGFTQKAAAAVAEATLSLLASLHDKALLWRVSDARFELHELLRQYAAEAATHVGLTTALNDAHGAYYSDLLAQSTGELKGGKQFVTLKHLNADNENIHAAWDWAAEQRHIVYLSRALDGLGIFYWLGGRSLAGERAYRLATDVLKSAADARLVHAQALIWQGHFCQSTGQAAHARQLLAHALERLEQLQEDGQDVRAARGMALWKLGDLLWYIDVEQSQQMIAESLQLCRAVGDRWWEAHLLRTLARNAWAVGNLRAAKEYAEQSLALRRTIGDRLGISGTLAIFVGIALERGELEQAIQYADEKIWLSQQMANRESYAQALFYLSRVNLEIGNLVEAAAQLEEGQKIAKLMGNYHHESSCISFLPEVVMHQGDFQQATIWARQALQQADTIDLRAHRGNTLPYLAGICLAKGDYGAASRYLNESLTIIQMSRHELKLSWLLDLFGYTAHALGNDAQAHQYLVRLLQNAVDWESVRAATRAFPLAALLLADNGEAERAVELYAVATTYPLIAHSRWYADVVGKEIDAAAATLPPKVVVAAQVRGRAQDPLACARQLLDGWQSDKVARQSDIWDAERPDRGSHAEREEPV